MRGNADVSTAGARPAVVETAARAQEAESARAARGYIDRGWAPVPIPPGEKGPRLRDWPELRITRTSLPTYFDGVPQNVGVILGAASGGLVDVDLDCEEAVALAPEFLPPTGAVFGRPSRPASHWLFTVASPPKPERFQDVGGAVLVEIRGNGQQTVFPPSTHPGGERVGWEADGDPDPAEAGQLRDAVARLAAAALLGRHWPAEGGRQDATLALAGGLLHSGWTEEQVADFVGAVARAAGDEEAPKRAEAAASTARTLARGAPTTGWPRLAQLVGDDVVDRVRGWLPPAPAGSASGPQDASGGRPSHATRLVALVGAGADLFHDAGREAFADVRTGGRRVTLPVQAPDFRQWLAETYWNATQKALPRQAYQDAVAVLEARARYEGDERVVATRLAEYGGRIYLDLGSDRWDAVEVDAGGWRIVAEPPVRFRRPRGLLPLPPPVAGGAVDELRPFVNVADDHWPLVLTWLVQAIRPTGPYPVLVLHGEQGSAKSTTARVLRDLIDPNAAALRAEPRNAEDLAIAARNGWVVSLDNLSRVSVWLSDALCRLATGGGFAVRQLYTNTEEVLFDAQRPVVLNGIEELATRGDLLDRALVVELPTVRQGKRRPESELWAEFAVARPRVLGALLDAVSRALRDLPGVRIDALPRLADFALWATAAEPALGLPAGAFMAAYGRSCAAAHDLALEASPVVPALRRLVAAGRWEGTATQLLTRLNGTTDEPTRHLRGWPTAARALTNTLRRLAPDLRATALDVAFLPREGGRRPITITRTGGDDADDADDAAGPACVAPVLDFD